MTSLKEYTRLALLIWTGSVLGIQEEVDQQNPKYICTTNSSWREYTLQCPSSSLINVTSAVIGRRRNGSSGRCYFVDGDRCLEDVAIDDEVVQCTGRQHCVITNQQRYLYRCDEWSQYLVIQYACVTADVSYDICRPAPLLMRNGDTHKSGFIFSPGYPSMYPNNQDCECKLSTIYGAKVKVEVIDFRLEDLSPDGSCTFDWLSLTDLHESERLCGEQNKGLIVTLAHQSSLAFSSDDGLREKGFWLHYYGERSDGEGTPVVVTCGPEVFSTTTPPDVSWEESGDSWDDEASGEEMFSSGDSDDVDDTTIADVHAQTKSTKSTNTVLIIGVACGAALVVITTIVITVCLCRRTRTPENKSPAVIPDEPPIDNVVQPGKEYMALRFPKDDYTTLNISVCHVYENAPSEDVYDTINEEYVNGASVWSVPAATPEPPAVRVNDEEHSYIQPCT